jgi:asparagine synthase (glutamine-hydrolysing)
MKKVISVPDKRWGERVHARYAMNHVDPWTDRRLVEFVLAAPQDVMCRRGVSKWIVKESMREIMPEEARIRLAKTLPTDFYQDAIRNRAADAVARITGGGDNAFLRMEYLRDHYRKIQAGEVKADGLFWNALTTGMWLKAWWPEYR